MHTLLRFVLLLDWLVALIWLWRAVTWRRNLGRVPDLIRDGDSLPPASCRLSVIVPARNEAKAIAAALRSLLDSEGVDLEIIAVDDRSEDATGSIMELMVKEWGSRSGTSETTLQVLHVEELPRGWLGKTHAMALAARHATGEWMLFTDGDVIFRPDTLRRALAFAVSSRAGHFVLIPTILLESRGERMMVAFLHVMSILAVRLWEVPNPRARRDAIGVGAFNMIQRQTYDAIGGWEALRTEVVEDLALGKRVKECGFAQRVAFGRGMASLRWVEGTFGAVQNLSKNLFALFRFRVELLIAFLLIFILFTIFPLGALLVGSAACWATGIMLAAVLLVYRRQADYQPFPAWEVISFPLASLLICYALVRSTVVVLKDGGVHWRGTFYSLSELRKHSKQEAGNRE